MDGARVGGTVGRVGSLTRWFAEPPRRDLKFVVSPVESSESRSAPALGKVEGFAYN